MARELPTDPMMGPAMKALPNDRWRAFALAYSNQGQKSAARAYAIVYDKLLPEQQNSNCVSATRLVHDERMQAALLEVAQRHLRSLTSLVPQVYEEIATNPQHPQRLAAANAIADRTGLHAVSEHKSTVQQIGDNTGLVKQIAAFATLLGMDPKKLLGDRIEAPMIDVTPTVVFEPEPEQW